MKTIIVLVRYKKSLHSSQYDEYPFTNYEKVGRVISEWSKFLGKQVIQISEVAVYREETDPESELEKKAKENDKKVSSTSNPRSNFVVFRTSYKEAECEIE